MLPATPLLADADCLGRCILILAGLTCRLIQPLRPLPGRKRVVCLDAFV
jgi:hypothetical protein